jgi:hypothetical protein
MFIQKLFPSNKKKLTLAAAALSSTLEQGP